MSASAVPTPTMAHNVIAIWPIIVDSIRNLKSSARNAEKIVKDADRVVVCEVPSPAVRGPKRKD